MGSVPATDRPPAAVALGTTKDTCQKLRALGCRNVLLCSQVALPADEIEQLSSIAIRDSQPFRVLSVGTLLHLKGFDLALKAFAQFRQACPGAEYWIIGEGMEKAGSSCLDLSTWGGPSRYFLGTNAAVEFLKKLAECDVRVLHPALHDSGGWASLEAMAAGRAVVCFDLGGPRPIQADF